MSKRSSLTKTNEFSSDNLSIKNDEYENKNEERKVKRKKTRRKTQKMKNDQIIKKKIEPIIIDELIDKDINILKIKIKKKPLKITFIYRRDKYEINLGQKANINDLKEKISLMIKLSIDKFNIILKNFNGDFEDGTLLKDIIEKTKIPVFYVKKKEEQPSILLSQIYYKNYNYKIIIDGIKDEVDLKKQIEIFFKNNLIIKDYIFKKISNEKYSIRFNSINIAFDFQRFLNILRLMNNQYYDIKITLKNEKRKNSKNRLNKSEIKNSKHFHYYSSPYVYLSTPYITYDQIKKKDELENKKKWICKKDFFSAVGNYSRRYNTEYDDDDYNNINNNNNNDFDGYNFGFYNINDYL